MKIIQLRLSTKSASTISFDPCGVIQRIKSEFSDYDFRFEEVLWDYVHERIDLAKEIEEPENRLKFQKTYIDLFQSQGPRWKFECEDFIGTVDRIRIGVETDQQFGRALENRIVAFFLSLGAGHLKANFESNNFVSLYEDSEQWWTVVT